MGNALRCEWTRFFASNELTRLSNSPDLHCASLSTAMLNFKIEGIRTLAEPLHGPVVGYQTEHHVDLPDPEFLAVIGIIFLIAFFCFLRSEIQGWKLRRFRRGQRRSKNRRRKRRR